MGTGLARGVAKRVPVRAAAHGVAVALVASVLVMATTVVPAAAGTIEHITRDSCGPQLAGSSSPGTAPILGNNQLFSNATVGGGARHAFTRVALNQTTVKTGVRSNGTLTVRFDPVAGGSPVTYTKNYTGIGPGQQKANSQDIPIAPGAYRVTATPAAGQEFYMSSNGLAPPCQPPDSSCPACDPSRPYATDGKAEAADPVSTWSQGFHDSFTDLSLPGRSEAGLGLSRTYWSLARLVQSPFGFGWASNLSMHIKSGKAYGTDVVGGYTFVQESGAQVAFLEREANGSSFAGPSDVNAALSRAGNGNLVVTRRSGEVVTFDPDGDLVSVADANGYLTAYEPRPVAPDTTQEIVEDSRAGGRKLVVTWTFGANATSLDDDRVVGVTSVIPGMSGGPAATYGYDANGDLRSVTTSDPSKSGDVYTWGYNYDKPGSPNIHDHLLRRVRDPRQSAAGVVSPKDLVNEYEGSTGKVLSQTDPAGRVTTFAESSANNEKSVVVTSTDPSLPAAVRRRVDIYAEKRLVGQVGAGQLKRQDHGPAGAPQNYRLFEYHPVWGALTGVRGNPQTAPSAEVLLESYVYDEAGRMTAATTHVATAGGAARTTTFGSFNAFGDPSTVTDNDGYVTTLTFDAAGNVESVCRPLTSSAEGSCATSPVDQLVDVVYAPPGANRPGEIASIVDPRGKTWTYGFDAFGSMTSITNPMGQRTRTSFDGAGRVLYEISGRGPATPDSAANPFATAFETNVWGDVTKVTDPLGAVTEIERSRNRQVTRVKRPAVQDGAIRTTDYVYDDSGNLTQTVEPNGVIQSSTYGPVNQLRTQTQNAKTTIYDYNVAGLVSSVTDPDGRATQFSYDPLGRLKVRTANGGGTTTYAYDLSGAVTSVNYSDATPDVTNVAYDAVGRRTAMTDGSGTSTWAWDSLGRLTSNTDGHGATTGHVWDLSDNLEKIAYPGGTCGATPTKCVTRTYDDAGRYTSVTDWNAKTTSFTPDANGNYTTYTYPTATPTTDTFGFDNADRLASVTYKKGAATQASLSYGPRFGAGELKSSTPVGITGATNEWFGYDRADRLCWVAPAASTNGCGSPPAGSAGYTHDASDNLTGLGDGTSQAFDPANQLCYTTPPGVAPLPTPPGAGCTGGAPGGATTYSYDGRGNRTSVIPPGGAPTTLGYNLENRLTAVTSPTAPDNDGEFNPLSGARILDTRSATRTGLCPTASTHCTTLAAGDTRDVQVTGQAGVPTSGVSAVAINVTAVTPTANGQIAVWASGDVPQESSALNFVAGKTIGNTVFAKVPASGRISLKALLGGTDLVVDVQGWFSAPTGPDAAQFNPLNQTRITDTRAATREGLCPTTTAQCTPLAINETRSVQIAGLGGVPASGVEAVALNVIAQNPAGQGNIKIWPANEAEPLGAAGPRFAAGETISVASVAKLSPDGRVNIKSSGVTDVLIDVQGWFADAPPGEDSVFSALNSDRLVDTRAVSRQGACPATTAECLTLNPADVPGVRTIQATGRAGIPAAGVTAVAINVKATNPAAAGYLKVYAAGLPPGVDEDGRIYYDAGDTIGNTVIVPVSPEGQIAAEAVGGGVVDLVIDVQGWFGTGTSTTSSYVYDGDGTRRSKTTDEGLTTFAWSATGGLPLLLTETSDAGTISYIYGPGGLPVAQIAPDGTTHYVRHDQLGSTRLLTDQAGDVAGTYTYEAFGQQVAHTGAATTKLGYAGQYTDPETGYQYLRARYYDPTTGQFLTRDPIEPLTREPYGYVGGNPINRVDPSGLYFGEGLVDAVVPDSAEEWFGQSIPGGGIFYNVARWQWDNPSEHADLLNDVGFAASVVEIGAAATGNGPVSAGAAILGTAVSAGEFIQGCRAGEPDHMISGAVGVGTAGLGKGAAKLATEIGATDRAVDVGISAYMLVLQQLSSPE